MTVTPSTMLPLGTQAPGFTLPDHNPATDAGEVSLKDVATDDGVLVMFLCNHCPYVKHVEERLAQLAKLWEDAGLGVVAISSNDVEEYPDDAPEGMAEQAERAGFTFPYLFDEAQDVAKAYKAACTPDFFLFDDELELVYRGQFDSSRPGSGDPVTGEDLSDAVEAVIAGEAVPEEQTPSQGCNIKWVSGNEPDYFG